MTIINANLNKICYNIQIKEFDMSGIQPVQSIKYYINPKNTGYAAFGGLCLTCANTMIKHNPAKKYHKTLGILTLGLTFLHVGTLWQSHHEKKV